MCVGVCVCVCGCDGVNEAFSTPECKRVSRHSFSLLSLVESCCELEILVAMLTDTGYLFTLTFDMTQFLITRQQYNNF